MPKRKRDDEPRQYSRKEVIKALADIEKAAKVAREAVEYGRDSCFDQIETIHSEINDLHWSMDAGVTPSIFDLTVLRRCAADTWLDEADLGYEVVSQEGWEWTSGGHFASKTLYCVDEKKPNGPSVARRLTVRFKNDGGDGVEIDGASLDGYAVAPLGPAVRP